MKKQLKLVSLVLLLMFTLMGCLSNGQNTSYGQANAYFVVLQQLMEEEPALNDGIKYIAVDMSETKIEGTAEFFILAEKYCKQNGYTLLDESIETLKEKGYINDMHFDEGVAIVFADSDLTEDTLKTHAMKWRSGTGAFGATYTVEKNGDYWELTLSEDGWIS